jgi:hypothetical protein
MADIVADTRDRIAALAAEAGIPLERDPNGDFFVHMESTTAFVQVSADGGGRPVLDVWAPTVVDVAITPDLLRFVAETSFMFGRLVIEPTEQSGPGIGQVVLSHTMLGAPLTPDVLLQVVGAIANSADQLDDDLVARFGGRRSSDPTAN